MRPSTLGPGARLPFFALLVILGSASALPATTTEEIRAMLAERRTEKAARAAEQMLGEASPAEIPALRYLRLKAYVLDLAPGLEVLYKKITKGEKDAMQLYEALLDRLEAEVRDQGEAVLPVLVEGLSSGDTLDRLLILGILQDMAALDLPWAVAVGDRSPLDAARDASLAAVEECAAREDQSGGKRAYALEDQREREPFVEAIYAAAAGLEFLAVADPDTWAATASFALECRSLAVTVFADRARVRENEARLRGPLVARMEGSERQPARMDAVDLLGRVGDCADLAPLRAAVEEGGEIEEIATVSADRILRRHGCPN